MGENRKLEAIVNATMAQRKMNTITVDDVVRGVRSSVPDAVERAHLFERLLLHQKTMQSHTVLRKATQKVIEDHIVRNNISKKIKFRREALIALDIVAASLVDIPLSKFDESPNQCLLKTKVLHVLRGIERSIGPTV